MVGNVRGPHLRVHSVLITPCKFPEVNLDNQAWKPVSVECLWSLTSHLTRITLLKLSLKDLSEDRSEILKDLLLLGLWVFYAHLWLFMKMGVPTLTRIFTTIIASIKVVSIILCIGLLYLFSLIFACTLLDIRTAPYLSLCLAFTHLID